MHTDSLINGRFLSRKATGVDRFASEVIRAWASSTLTNTPAQIAVPRSAMTDNLGHIDRNHINRVGRTSGVLWEQTELPHFARDRMLLNLCNTGPLRRSEQLVVIHDAATAATPENYSPAFRLWYRAAITQLMRHSRIVATVSKFSADELVKYYGRPRNGIEVVSESGEHILREPADDRVLERLGVEKNAYVLAVGSSAKNKNLGALQHAIALLQDSELSLLAVGNQNPKVFAGQQEMGGAVKYTGYLTDPELRALYQGAFCFVFPSLYEGFGLPPLEAMSCGCPVVASDRASLPEVCGSAALYCEPTSPSSIAAKIRELKLSRMLREEMLERGHDHARKFKWRTTAEQLAGIAASN